MNPLAIRNYRHEKNLFTAEDFSLLPTLILILNEVLTGESDLTDEGKKFIKEQGYNNLAEKIAKIGGLIELNDGQNVQVIEETLKKLKPMENKKFMK